MNIHEEFIVCSAIHFDDKQKHVHQPFNIETGFIICGLRHHNCYATLSIFDTEKEIYLNVDSGRKGQGFLTSKNRFVGRKEAFQIAKRQNQIYHHLHDETNENELVSEDLYSENLY